MSELRPIENRRNWKGVIANYQEVIAEPASTKECFYCLTEPQAQLLIMYADTLRWRTRWINWDGDMQAIEDFANDLIERLIMSCCPEQNQQIITRVSNDGKYTLQVSYDGGATWETDNSDPRLTAPALPPLPPSTTNLKCQAAWNMRKGIKDAVQMIAGVLDVSLTLFAVSFAIAGVLAIILTSPTEAYRLVPIVIQLAVQIAALSDTDFLAAFSSADYDYLQCAIFCSLNEEGQLTDIAPMLDLLFVNVSESGIPGNTFKLIAWGIGLIGLNAMGSTDRGAIGYDCDGCECPVNCGTNWEINPDAAVYYAGMEIIDVGDDYITVKSGTFSGNYRIYVLSLGGVSDCCRLADFSMDGVNGWEVLSGSLSGNPFYVECGDTDPNHFVSFVAGTCFWSLQFQCAVPDTVVKINFRPC